MSLDLKLFLCGIFGSAIVEALTILRYYQRPGPIPARYRRRGFWAVRTLVALGGGVFALLYYPANLLLAAHIGASTPLLVSALAETLPDGTPHSENT